MPRRARHYIAGQPYHIVRRGNNREPCFIERVTWNKNVVGWKSAATSDTF